MKCEEVKYQIPDLLFDKLQEEERIIVIKHLKECKNCEEEFKKLQELFSTIEDSIPWKPSNTYFTTILPRVNEKIKSSSKYSLQKWIKYIVIPTASAFLLIFIIYKLFPIRDEFQNGDLGDLLKKLSLIEIQTIAEQQDNYYKLEITDITKNDSLTLAGDLDNMKELLEKENNIFYYSAFDPIAKIETMGDEEVNRLISMLENKQL